MEKNDLTFKSGEEVCKEYGYEKLLDYKITLRSFTRNGQALLECQKSNGEKNVIPAVAVKVCINSDKWGDCKPFGTDTKIVSMK